MPAETICVVQGGSKDHTCGTVPGGANVEELRMWTMDGTGGSVAYFIMDGERKMTVTGKHMSLRELARSNRKTRSTGQWAKIVRAEQAWFLLLQSGKTRDLGVEGGRSRFYALLSRGDELMMIVLLLFLQKQNLASAIYLFGLGKCVLIRQDSRGVQTDAGN
jgi:hypothetical protein